MTRAARPVVNNGQTLPGSKKPTAKKQNGQRRKNVPMTHYSPPPPPPPPPPPHYAPAPAVPPWLWPIIINCAVMILAVGVTYGLMKGDIAQVKADYSTQSIQLASQSSRIDGLLKEQDRITRLEERLSNITSLLQEIRGDLRTGSYSTGRKSPLPPSEGR